MSIRVKTKNRVIVSTDQSDTITLNSKKPKQLVSYIITENLASFNNDLKGNYI